MKNKGHSERPMSSAGESIKDADDKDEQAKPYAYIHKYSPIVTVEVTEV